MEENVALDTSKQKKFVKTIKGIKKLLKKKQLASPEQHSKPIRVKPKAKPLKTKQRKKPRRGLVYLSHIPHGFYEPQMADYFKQFGGVTNVRVIKSKRTGRSKGHAFVEFREPTVAKIVAETMNNYLMGKRLIKAAYIPPDKIRAQAVRKNWNAITNPSAERRLKQKKACNAFRTEDQDLKRSRKILGNLTKTKQKLSEMGINYDFFSPVDIPEALIEIKLKEDPEEVQCNLSTIKSKSKKKKKKVAVNTEEVKDEPEVKELETIKIEETLPPKVKKTNKKKKTVNPQMVTENKFVQQIDNKLKKAEIKPLQDFIQIQNDSDNNDSSDAFDSDEFERMLVTGSDSDSLPDNDEELTSSEVDETTTDIAAKMIKKGPVLKAVQSVQLNTKAKKVDEKNNTSQQIKRKAPATTIQQVAVTPKKKTKFEKQMKNIPAKKQLKIKK